MANNLSKALELQAQGLSIYPLATNANVPLKGSNGFNDATNDINRIKQWWGNDSTRNIGLMLQRHNWVVIDIDNHKEDVNGWENFIKLKRPLSPTYTEKTPRNGLHFFYKIPEGVEIQSEQNAFSEALGIKETGIDIVTLGVPIAPTVTNNGAYEAMDGKGFADISELPDWVAPLLKKRERAEANYRPVRKTNVGEWLDFVFQGVPEGNRDSKMTSFCGWLLYHGVDNDTFKSLVYMANKNSDPPMNDKQIVKIMRSMVKKDVRR